jgi:porin
MLSLADTPPAIIAPATALPAPSDHGAPPSPSARTPDHSASNADADADADADPAHQLEAIMVKARQLDIPPSIKPYRLPNPAAPVQPGVAGSYWPSPHLLGGWLGARDRLAERGITASVNYVGEISANLDGGTSRKARYADQWAFGLKVATPNILGGPPATTQITITHRGGQGINAANGVETLQLPAEIYGRGEIWRLTQASYRAGRGDFEMKIGRIPVGDDFASAGCEFQTLYVCGATPGQISPDYWHNYPVAPWGVRFKQTFGKAFFTQIGAYQVSAANIDPLHGFRLGLKDTTGVLIPAEIDWFPKFRNGLSGIYKIGVWFTSAAHADVVLNTKGQPVPVDGGTPLMRGGMMGFYANLRQQLIKPREDGSGGLVFFANAAVNDGRTTKLDRKFALGIIATGLVPGRRQDEIGLAIGTVHVNGRLTQAYEQLNAQDGGVEIPRAEVAGEIFYGISPLPGIIIRPNIQIYHNPGGYADRKDVVFLGTKTVINF